MPAPKQSTPSTPFMAQCTESIDNVSLMLSHEQTKRPEYSVAKASRSDRSYIGKLLLHPTYVHKNQCSISPSAAGYISLFQHITADHETFQL